MTQGRLDWFRLAAWLPPLSFGAIFAYVSGFEGWGRWSAAPLLLAPALVSLPITLVGLLRIRAERARGGIAAGTIVATAIAALPLLWLLWRLAISR